jgi:hypothetical protein
MPPTKPIPRGAIRVIRAALTVLAVSSGLVYVDAHAAYACTIDGKPSALANGRRATLSRDVPTSATLRTWASFTFAGRYHARASIRFAEDRTTLRTALSPDALAHPLRWDLGDGTWADGWTVTHHYGKPGVYRISIAAYDAGWRRYFPFDLVRVIIAR